VGNTISSIGVVGRVDLCNEDNLRRQLDEFSGRRNSLEYAMSFTMSPKTVSCTGMNFLQGISILRITT
jgi:hypothetical protein